MTPRFEFYHIIYDEFYRYTLARLECLPLKTARLDCYR
jgi:hypothetical protein